MIEINGNWNEYVRLVMHELNRSEERHNAAELNRGKILEELIELRKDLSIIQGDLRLKGGIWGLLGGAISVLITIGIGLLIKFGGN